MARNMVERENIIRRKIPDIFGRKIKRTDIATYEKVRRGYRCLYDKIKNSIPIEHLDHAVIRYELAHNCRNIEEQIIHLRSLICMQSKDYSKRVFIIKEFLNCLLRHHGVVYEGLLFGSSISGLGFKDSDLDLRLRPLLEVDVDLLEPIEHDRASVENILKNIAYQTAKCSPAFGYSAPGGRCPLAALQFVRSSVEPERIKYCDNVCIEQGIKLDVSMLARNSLGSFNSKYIRFLCHLEPKFHLLAIVLRYWSKSHDLIQQGRLSSYALLTMLIFFCQNISPPLLPTVDKMRETYFRDLDIDVKSDSKIRIGMLRQEWNCLISFSKKSYEPTKNSEPLCVLILKFFEFYLNFPYSTTGIMTTRTGQYVNHNEFKASLLFDDQFPVKTILNIQDPFDLSHNVTCGMTSAFFKKFLLTTRYSYERLFTELGTFTKPTDLTRKSKLANNNQDDNDNLDRLESWGLNVIFYRLTKKKLKSSRE